MNNDLISAEKRAYAKGYNAGKKYKERKLSLEQARRIKQAFLDRAFLAALPAAMQLDGWKVEGKPAIDMNLRVRLARAFALEALKQRPFV